MLERERDGADVRCGAHGRGPALRLDQADLADDLAGTERRDPLAVAQHVDRAGLEHEEHVGHPALLHQRLTLVQFDVHQPAGELAEVVRVELPEQRQLGQAVDVHGAHGPTPLVASRTANSRSTT